MTHDAKKNRYAQYVSKYPQRVRVSLMFIIVIACSLLLWLEFGSQEAFRKDIYYEIITGVTFTTITIFIISLFNWMIGTKDIQTIQKEQTLAQIIDLMSGNTPDHKSIVSDLYTPEAAVKVMKNALSRLNRRLAQGYSLIAACDKNVIRENFDYDISMYQRGENDFYMGQSLSYKRYFKFTGDQSQKCYLQCGFAFSTEGLNKLLEHNCYFLREEITDTGLITVLKEALGDGDVAKAVNALRFKVYTAAVHNDIEAAVPVGSIEILPIEDEDDHTLLGVNIRTEVDFAEEDDNMRSYSGRVSFVIPAPDQRRFYCVFADPVIGNTIFRFRIDPRMVDNIKDVEYVEILTRTGEDGRHVVRTGEYSMEFHTQDTILPKSAIIAFW